MLTAADVKARLTADAAVTALVADRVFPGMIREADRTYPYLIFKRDATTTGEAYDGSPGLSSTSLTVAAVGGDPDSAEAAILAVVASLNAKAGVWGQTTVQGAFLDESGISDDVDVDTDDEDVTAFIYSARFDVAFQTAPNPPTTIGPPVITNA